jgi:hypothetical protein
MVQRGVELNACSLHGVQDGVVPAGHTTAATKPSSISIGIKDTCHGSNPITALRSNTTACLQQELDGACRHRSSSTDIKYPAMKHMHCCPLQHKNYTVASCLPQQPELNHQHRRWAALPGAATSC